MGDDTKFRVRATAALVVVGAALLGVGASLWASADAGVGARQAGWIALGVVVAGAVAAAPTMWLRRAAYPVAVGTACLVVCFAMASLGASRLAPWASLALVLALARLSAERSRERPSVSTLAIGGACLLVPAGLWLARPDAAAAAIAFAVAASVVLLLRGGSAVVAVTMASLALAAPAAWRLLLHAYQRDRILSWLNPEGSPLGAGYAQLTLRDLMVRGDATGEGLGSWAERAGDLPSALGDAPFAVLVHEQGALGGAVLIALFGAVIGIVAWLATTTRDPLFRGIAVGIGAWWLAHIALSVGGAVGWLPLTATALPLVTPRGASTVAALASLGLLAHIAARLPARTEMNNALAT